MKCSVSHCCILGNNYLLVCAEISLRVETTDAKIISCLCAKSTEKFGSPITISIFKISLRYS